MNKAKFKFATRDRFSRAVYLFYEYRGREYMVVDMHNGYSETMATQHHREQQYIDDALDKPVPEEHKGEDAKIGLDLFFESVGD